jgi:hypothetical protein
MKMKKVFFFAALAAATVSMTSCNNDDEVIDNNAPVEIRLSSTNEASLSTRSNDQDIQLTQFDASESIGVFINEDAGTPTTTYSQPLEYTANGSGGMTTPAAQYFPQSGRGVNIHAFYPFSAASDLETIGNFSIATNQSTDVNYKASDLMYGVPASNPVERTSSAVQLTFNHLLSKINIELKAGNGLNASQLEGATVKLIGIKPETTFDPATGAITAATGTATDITVMTTDVTRKGSAIIVPQTRAINAAFIEVTLATSGKLTYKLTAETTFTGKNQYDYEITVNLTELTVTSTISPWLPVGSATTGIAIME